jgi:hypothetical protein
LGVSSLDLGRLAPASGPFSFIPVAAEPALGLASGETRGPLLGSSLVPVAAEPALGLASGEIRGPLLGSSLVPVAAPPLLAFSPFAYSAASGRVSSPAAK